MTPQKGLYVPECKGAPVVDDPAVVAAKEAEEAVIPTRVNLPLVLPRGGGSCYGSGFLCSRALRLSRRYALGYPKSPGRRREAATRLR